VASSDPRIGIPRLGLGLDDGTCIGGGVGAFLLEYTCSGQEELGNYSLCIIPCKSLRVRDQRRRRRI